MIVTFYKYNVKIISNNIMDNINIEEAEFTMTLILNLAKKLVNDDYVFKNAHIISNHMNVSTNNIAYFDDRYFNSL
ncbi:hypothetical protein CBU02nite_24540 [Clostridium butyricum]|uniref:Uncharacterized protein n=2 Tax=Clostridium butyricum TaxID=1492 RepID=A0A512TPN6_CLOBU|nr:MAG: D-3-phosphoglycerate dehydrogenase [Clostridium butyricum DORA_1]GEQ21948.1 hypothetical protein CBU02nite_24540 [Clostridium butyricum]